MNFWCFKFNIFLTTTLKKGKSPGNEVVLIIEIMINYSN